MTTYPYAPRSNIDGTPKPETDEEFHERVLAFLEVWDASNRLERAGRLIWVDSNLVSVDTGYWDRSETAAAMQEARSSFIQGNFISTLVLALAYVEHVVNDALPPPPPNKRAPTMSDAIKKARDAGLFPCDLLDEALVLYDFRNPLAHRRKADDPDTLGERVRDRKSHPRLILEHDARDALLLMYAFFRYSLTQPQ